MDANDFGGHTSALPRLFSIPVLAVGVGTVSHNLGNPLIPGQFPSGDEALAFGSAALLVGLHGLITNTSKVGIIRKFLSYASGVAGGVICWNVAQQMGLF